MAQWLKLHAPSAESPGSIPGQGTRSHMQQQRSKILHASTKTQHSQINKMFLKNFKEVVSIITLIVTAI